MFLVGKKKKQSQKKSTSSRVSTILTTQMESIIEKLRMERYRDSMKKMYYTVWKSFNDFYLRLDLKPKNWEDRLTLLIGFLIQENKQSSTI